MHALLHLRVVDSTIRNNLPENKSKICVIYNIIRLCNTGVLCIEINRINETSTRNNVDYQNDWLISMV